MDDKRQIRDTKNTRSTENVSRNSDFVLEKVIFSNIFEKDIRRIYIYKKSERLAKALALISPAFEETPSLRVRLEEVSVALIDAAVLPPATAQKTLPRELLALSSLLSLVRTRGLLSEMNADLVIREAQNLLHEVAGYEEPRLSLEEVPTLAEYAKTAARQEAATVLPMVPARKVSTKEQVTPLAPQRPAEASNSKGHISDSARETDRQQAILNILGSKGTVYIKDISTIIKDVSEKTIQRELQALVQVGKVQKTGERRWTQYSLA